jgi:hypothetical protein
METDTFEQRAEASQDQFHAAHDQSGAAKQQTRIVCVCPALSWPLAPGVVQGDIGRPI